MIEGFLIAIGVLGCGIVYHIMNKHIKKSEDRAVKAEADALVAKGYKENAEQHVITLQKNHAEFVEMIKAEMSYKINELEEQYKKHAEDRIQKVINDYEEALKLETESLEQQVAELDEQLGIKIQEITLKNIMLVLLMPIFMVQVFLKFLKYLMHILLEMPMVKFFL